MTKGSAKTTILGGAGGLLLLAVLAWFGLISPALGAVSEAETARTDAQDQHDTMAVQLAGLRRQVDELPQLARTARRLETIFPATADQPGFFASVNEAAEQAGISADDVRSISLASPVVLGVEPDAAPPEQAAPPTSEGTPIERADGAAAQAGDASQARSALPEGSADGTTDGTTDGTDAAAPVDVAQLAAQSVSIEVAGDYDQLRMLTVGLEQMERALLIQSVVVTVEEATQSTDGSIASVDPDTGVVAGGTMFVMTISGSTFVAPPLGDAPRAPGAR